MSGLPEYVRKCGLCAGEGEYVQTYTIGCGMGTINMKGRCDWCDGTGYKYHDGGPVPASVLNQIREATLSASQPAPSEDRHAGEKGVGE